MGHRELGMLLLLVATFCLGCAEPTESAGGSTVGGSAQSRAKVAVISITSDPLIDLQEVNMGLTFAGFCVDERYDVNIFLNVKGVKLATNEFPEDTKFQDHDPLKKPLVALAERGVQVHVCPVCMKDFSIESNQIIPDAFVTSKPKLFAKLGADTMVFTY